MCLKHHVGNDSAGQQKDQLFWLLWKIQHLSHYKEGNVAQNQLNEL